MGTRLMQRMGAGILTVVTIVMLYGHGSAIADAAGQIKRLRGTATIERGGETVAAEVGTKVEVMDRIMTGDKSAVGISLHDDSRISAGPNSVLVIEDFSFDTTTHDGKSLTKIERGTLTVVSGKLAKRSETAMSVRTPQSVLGVRGTKFLVKVLGD